MNIEEILYEKTEKLSISKPRKEASEEFKLTLISCLPKQRMYIFVV
jgi:hypothetical protein